MTIIVKEKEKTNYSEIDKEEEEQDAASNLLVPFSRLFFTSLINEKQPAAATVIHNKPITTTIIHNKSQCMFIINLDSKGRTAALCYLPTRVKDVIETYHTEIPLSYRNRGIGDKLVKECLTWAKESGTLVIPTCKFVKRHLECHQYDIIVKDEKEALKIKKKRCTFQTSKLSVRHHAVQKYKAPAYF
ncbi:MAG: GCN5-related N-acetyl-transferase-domain-containing protein [Benjaminiella poitrasii]|nr:MAG: GCN5-related N-acetyl-transferase-domain-containing protein [Benjaminiella poitrasii]